MRAREPFAAMAGSGGAQQSDSAPSTATFGCDSSSDGNTMPAAPAPSAETLEAPRPQRASASGSAQTQFEITRVRRTLRSRSSSTSKRATSLPSAAKTKLPAVLGSAAKPVRAPASGRVSSRQRLPRRDGDGGAAESSSQARTDGRESVGPACGGLPDVPQMVTALVSPGVSPEAAEVVIGVYGGRESASDLGRPGGDGSSSS